MPATPMASGRFGRRLISISGSASVPMARARPPPPPPADRECRHDPRKSELGARTQHAVRLDAANDAFAEGNFLGGNKSARRGEHRFEAGPRVWRAADDLHQSLAADVDAADLQPIGVRVRVRLDDLGDDEILKRLGRVVDMLDLKPDFGQRRNDLVKRGIGLDMVLEPGKSKFHRGPKKAAGLSGTKRVSPAAQDLPFPVFRAFPGREEFLFNYKLTKGFRRSRGLSCAIATGRFKRGPAAVASALRIKTVPSRRRRRFFLNIRRLRTAPE